METTEYQYFTKNYTKNTPFIKPSEFDFCRNFPKICENFPSGGVGEGRKRGKKGLFGGVFRVKMQFYFTEYQQDN